MEVASSPSSTVKAFAVCVGVESVQIVKLATLCSCYQPAATSSGESRFLHLSVGSARSQLSLAVVDFPIPAVVQSL